jgi:hypothetical protein
VITAETLPAGTLASLQLRTRDAALPRLALAAVALNVWTLLALDLDASPLALEGANAAAAALRAGADDGDAAGATSRD